MKRVRGFTLLELMIVLVVIAILAGLALSGYQKQVRKSRRAEAKQALSDLSLRQEKFRSNSATYATTCDNLLSPSTCASFNSGLLYYTVTLGTLSSGTCPVASGTGPTKGYANSYVLTATPKGSDQPKDTGCATLVLTNDCGTMTKTSTGGNTDCW
jgi:type IV pilus assembly protein PilE